MPTPSWDFVRAGAGLRMLVESGCAHGLTVEQVVAGTGLTHADVDDPEVRVEAGQEIAIARNLIAALGDLPGLGVDAGVRTTISTFGVFGFALLTSATLGDTLAIAMRFWELSSGFARVSLERDGRRILLHADDDEIPADVRDLLIERDLAAILVFLRMILGDPRQAHLRLRTRLRAARAQALAAVEPAVPVLAGGPCNVLEMEAADLDLAPQQADAATRRACEQECVRLLDARRRRAGTSAHVRALLLETPSAMPTLARIATRLNFDVRTLRRHLAAEGTSYRALRQEVAMTLALELLQTVGLPVCEVAGRVGYADPTAFTHAFKRWHGQPPSAVRISTS
ncbi:AraC family transcriptional regulator [Patulibacter medicamentivorans]|uniref:AraC family transcriptional regulator n=1 Tax=Patulibacter medicamentivorans TaxID=1097667 RepID=UPI0014780939|nr:AraC family transcriptional regulator [Patulibacter medicamentivorans]